VGLDRVGQYGIWWFGLGASCTMHVVQHVMQHAPMHSLVHDLNRLLKKHALMHASSIPYIRRLPSRQHQLPLSCS
jgi:hypothetical protein